MGTDHEGAGSPAELQAVLQRLVLAGRTNAAAATLCIEAIDRELRRVLKAQAGVRRGPALSDVG
jgi:hypothetical protein